MIKKSLTRVFLLVLTVTLFTGCSLLSLKPQAVVVDIRTISETTGINERIKERTETMKQQFTGEMQAISASSRKEFEDEKTSLGENPSEGDRKKLQTLRSQLQQRIVQARNEGTARITKATAEVRQAYLDDIMAVVETVARERGARIILGANTGVVWSEDSVNITDEVIRRMSDSTASRPADGEVN